MLGFVSVAFAQDGLTPETDYDAIIATFAGFAGGIVLLVEGIKLSLIHISEPTRP